MDRRGRARGPLRGSARAALLFAAGCVGVLLLVVGWMAARVATYERTRKLEPRTTPAEEPELRAPAPPGAPRDSGGARRAEAASSREEVVEVARAPERASLVGTVRIDGQAPWRTTIRAVSDDGWEGSATADSDGRFALEDVPARPLRLALEPEQGMMEAVEGRVLLLPDVAVAPVAGEREVLELDWTSRHVNVLVVDEEPLVAPARVQLEGPSYAASFVTSETGRARLALVGGGHFVLRAELPSGRRGEVEVELGDDDELDTVVVSTASRAP